MNPTEREALALAAKTGVTQYVNKYRPSPRDRDEVVLFIDAFKRASCCAIARPDGTLDRVVQGFSLAVALTIPIETNLETINDH